MRRAGCARSALRLRGSAQIPPVREDGLLFCTHAGRAQPFSGDRFGGVSGSLRWAKADGRREDGCA